MSTIRTVCRTAYDRCKISVRFHEVEVASIPHSEAWPDNLFEELYCGYTHMSK
jgi:hypothetical protein